MHLIVIYHRKYSYHYHLLLYVSKRRESQRQLDNCIHIGEMSPLIDADVIGCSSDERGGRAYQPRFAIECNFYCAAQQR